MKTAQKDHPQNELVLEFAGALVAEIQRSAARAHLGHAPKELALLQESLHLPAVTAVAVDYLPMTHGILQLG